jgi:hypothetical protein
MINRFFKMKLWLALGLLGIPALQGCLPPKTVIGPPEKELSDQTSPVVQEDLKVEAGEVRIDPQKKEEEARLEQLIKQLEETEQRLLETQRKAEEALKKVERASNKTAEAAGRIQKAQEKMEAVGQKVNP